MRDRATYQPKLVAIARPHAASVEVWLCGGVNVESIDCWSTVCMSRIGLISPWIEYRHMFTENLSIVRGGYQVNEKT